MVYVVIQAVVHQLLDSPALLDLGHGTIRYRHNDVKKKDNSLSQDKKTGYFYHPKLELSSAGNKIIEIVISHFFYVS